MIRNIHIIHMEKINARSLSKERFGSRILEKFNGVTINQQLN